jgi:hypothetical protein
LTQLFGMTGVPPSILEPSSEREMIQMDGQETFVAVRKNNEGDITHFKTSGGRELDYTAALQEVKNGIIAGVNVGATRGEEHHAVIRGNPDGDPTNNLDNLPPF